MSNNLTIRNARIIFRNFRGIATQFKPAGDRSFTVVIEDENLANDLIADGWNVRPLKAKFEDQQDAWRLDVSVRYGKFPPNIYLICGNTKTLLTEENVGLIDGAQIEKVDLTINPSHYNAAGRSGIKAYVKTMMVTIVEDELEREYADVGVPF